MAKPLVSDELWAVVEPLIPKVERRYRFPGRKRIDVKGAITPVATCRGLWYPFWYAGVTPRPR